MKKIEMKELFKGLAENCEHIFKISGYGDQYDEKGKRIGGLITMCTKCKGYKGFSYDEWRNCKNKLGI